MFEKASRLKLRFTVANGTVNIEDLWGMSAEKLNGMAQAIHAELKDTAEISFIPTTTPKKEDINTLRLDILKRIIEVKIAERTQREAAQLKSEKRELIRDLMHKKQLSELEQKSLEELQKEYDELL